MCNGLHVRHIIMHYWNKQVSRVETSRAVELSVVNSVAPVRGKQLGGGEEASSHQQPLKMPQVFVTRRETLSAAHRLHCVHLSDEENQELYGPCNNIHGHGHNYVIEVVCLLVIFCSLQLLPSDYGIHVL